MKIRLSEIPQEGRSYSFDRASGELDANLEDLIGKNDYKVNLFVKPIGNAFELRGELKTTVPELCAKCGYDFDLEIERKCNEILYEDIEEHRKNHTVHGNQSVDFLGEGPSSTPYKGDLFDLGEYVHEVIVITEPLYPTCGPNGECLHIDEVNEILRKLEMDAEKFEEETKRVGHPAFSVLKGISLSSKN